MNLQPYAGTPDRPVPPVPSHWQDVPNRDAFARSRANALLAAGMPAYHYGDERGPGGIYRFYSYETPFGMSVSALRRPLEAEPSVYAEGTLGQTNPNFVAPPASSSPNGATGATGDAAAALLNFFDTNGVPSEHVQSAPVGAFQTAYNADPISQVPDGQLNVDQEYGPNTFAALSAVVGDIAPPVNPNAGPPPAGQTTPQPMPATDATCSQWAADATTPQAVAIATSIAFHNTPVAWSDQGQYNTTINGTDYLYLMHWENGLKAVVAWKCTAGSGAGPAAASTASSSSAGPIIAGVLVVGALVATGFAARKPLGALYRRHA
ncbi:MAG TPA: hypothetical protein VK989_00675 [Polyangia bacterium]|jgi:hypothetical protein|nr:hypothetical protein [Polyangia bacterium]